MRTATWGILAAANLLAAVSSGQDKPATPAEQFKALKKEYDTSPPGDPTRSDAERVKFIGRVYKHHAAVGEKLLALAEKHPDDPVAVDALLLAAWQVNTNPWPVELTGEDPARPKAFDRLVRDHVGSDQLAPLCRRVANGCCEEYVTFLRAVLAKSPHKEVQAAASLSLAQFLNNRAQRIDLCREEPEREKEFGGLFGKEYLAGLLKQDRDKRGKEIESAFEQAADKFGEEKLPDGGTVGERAKVGLFEVRHLSVGKEAPDIEGEDQDGKRFKLSEYRGKVVLLDFWSFV